MNDQSYISRQISVYKTDKRLVELLDKLNPAPLDSYAHIHAQGDEDESGHRSYSNIGIVIQDYAAGTGDKLKRTAGNLSPDEQGYALVTKLRILRMPTDANGNPRRYPWYMEVENGKGKPQRTQIGGTYCQQGSFVSETKAYANLNDLDFYKMFSRAVQYIQTWELAIAPAIIRQARKQIEENRMMNP